MNGGPDTAKPGTGTSSYTPEAAPTANVTPRPEAAPRSDSATTGNTRLSSCSNLKVNADKTTCPFAQNVFWQYWHAVQTEGRSTSISVYSTALDRWRSVSCRDAGSIVCTTEDGAEVRIRQDALVGYTQSMADAYAASHIVRSD